MFSLREYHLAHPTKFRNYNLPQNYRNTEKKRNSSLKQQWLAKALSLSLGLYNFILIILSARK